jgi:hypothetical protein
MTETNSTNKEKAFQDSVLNQKESYIDTYLKKIKESKEAIEQVDENNQITLKSDNLLVLRAENIVILHDKSDLKVSKKEIIEFDFKDSEFPDTNLLKDEGKEEKEKTEEFKYDLDQELDSDGFRDKNLSIIKSFEIEKENLNSRSKQDSKFVSDDVQKPKKDKEVGIFGQIKTAFASDVFWQVISGVMILSLFLFYFQGLQPAILNNYYQKFEKQSTELREVYLGQVSSFYQIQNKIADSFFYDPGQLCVDTPFYESAADDIDEINRLKVNLFPKKNLVEIEKTGPFYDQEIRDIYSGLYSDYEASLIQIENINNQAIDSPQFLNYRNSWITACQNLQEDNFRDATISSSCAELSTATETFKEQPGYTSLPEAQQNAIQQGLDACNQAGDNSKTVFSTEWFLAYDLVMSYRVDSVVLSEPIPGITQAFSDQVTNAINNGKKIRNDKTDLFGLWYIISFE